MGINLLSATLIYDGQGEPALPPQLQPAGKSEDEGARLIQECGQFVGTPLERLCEMAARACYDSAGRGRNSANMHKHIIEVGHLSVLEHAVFTMNLAVRHYEHVAKLAIHFLNRPGVWVRQDGPYALSVTMNLRHAMEWDKWPSPIMDDPDLVRALGAAIQSAAHGLAPQIVPPPAMNEAEYERVMDEILDHSGPWFICTLRKPFGPEECWGSMLLTGS